MKAYMKNNDISTRGLMRYLKGPDFPTGGIVVNKDDLVKIYESGTGKLRIRGRVEIEKLKGGRQQLVITEIPYTCLLYTSASGKMGCGYDTGILFFQAPVRGEASGKNFLK